MSWVEMFEDFSQGDFLSHEGRSIMGNPPAPGVGSGRWPLGFGDRPFQRSYDEYSRYRSLLSKGWSQDDIARAFGYYVYDRKGNIVLHDRGPNAGLPRGNTSLLRARVMNVAGNDVRVHNIKEAQRLSREIDPDTGKEYTNKKIGEMLGGLTEGTIRGYLKKDPDEGTPTAVKVADQLREFIKDGNYADVGLGIERSLDVSQTALKTSLEILKDEGYVVHNITVTQLGGDGTQKTTLKVLCPPGTEWKDAMNNTEKIKWLDDPGGDSSLTRLGMRVPVSVARDRIKVVLDEDGGSKKDGVIEIRAYRDKDGVLHPASPDLDLGNSKYAQVRIAVEGDKYIKGMAVYNTNLPKNVDILVNSNKSVKDGEEKAFKDMKTIKDKDGNVIGVDWDNPFGSTVWQEEYKDSQGNNKLSAINVVSDRLGVDQHREGSWGEWSKNLPSQFLGKQSDVLVKEQLKLKALEKQQELDEIKKLTNPVVKEKMLLDFADGCDKAAADLKAAPFPGQRVQVILPINSLKETEAYAPNYDNGTTLALVRFPHTGPFEVPIVKVNNNNKEAKEFLVSGKELAKDAIGINYKTANILSGADFDGDTVTVIPMTRKNAQGVFESVVNIRGVGNGATKLPGMDDFDPKKDYRGTDSSGKMLPGVKRMTEQQKQIEMGVVSNLITDMMLKGCTDSEEQARAVKYSMVVIDAAKHGLDFRRAEKELDIKELKKKYQDGKGPSTLLSQAKQEVRVKEWDRSGRHGYDIDPKTGEKVYRKGGRDYYIDPATGKKVRQETGRQYEELVKVKARDPVTGRLLKDENGKQIYETYTTKSGGLRIQKEPSGKVKDAKTKTIKMEVTDDARSLMSKHPSNKEMMYADFANKMKALGNESRKEYLKTSRELDEYKIDPVAKKRYFKEVESLSEKLDVAKRNAPRERQAQVIGNQIVKAKMDENPWMTSEEASKSRGQALNYARDKTGANKVKVTFTDKEWEAVQNRAIGKTTLRELLKNSKPEHYTSLATPRQSRISEALEKRIEAMLANGWTPQEIADSGVAALDTIRKVQSGGL